MSCESVRYKAHALLRDGVSIQIRALRPDDKHLLQEFFGNLSQRSVYFRLFRAKHRLSDSDLERHADLDFKSTYGLAATMGRADSERILGTGRYISLPENQGGGKHAEITLAVADEEQNRGIGTVLLEHLASVARANGISHFEADVLAENARMLKVFEDSGFEMQLMNENGVTHVSFPIEVTLPAALAQQRRACVAAERSLQPLLRPGSVAVIGASRQAGTIGAALVSNLKRCGFTGSVYPINPKADQIDGIAAYPGIGAVGRQVDLALIAVPAPLVEQAVRDCANAGVRGVVIVSSGFGEVAPEGRLTEKLLRELARRMGMRLIGPNCMGVLNSDPAIRLNATFVPSWPRPGNIGVVSQSGALGYVILNHIQSLDVGVSAFVSVGNTADVSANDLLCYLAEEIPELMELDLNPLKLLEPGKGAIAVDARMRISPIRSSPEPVAWTQVHQVEENRSA